MWTESRHAHPIFSEWTIYRKVVENDYMHHNAVTRVIDRALREIPAGFSVLDLGCGDAEVVARLVSEGRIGAYVGVDQSQAALDAARERLTGHIQELELVQSNLLAFLQRTSRCFDVVLCGYTLHHLSAEEKTDFFRFVSRVLKPDAVLVVYDVFRPKVTTREALLESYIDWIADHWTAIDPEEHAAISTHMRTADFPETLGAFCDMARAAGLNAVPEPDWSCERNFHHLLRISH